MENALINHMFLLLIDTFDCGISKGYSTRAGGITNTSPLPIIAGRSSSRARASEGLRRDNL
jgi:hypothetical protein